MDAAAMTCQTHEPDVVTISCYNNDIPDFIEAELVRLYDALHSSLPFFEIFRSTKRVSSYVASRNGTPVAIFLFTHTRRRIEVLNEMIEVDHVELDRFVSYVFAHFPSVDIISFKALKADTKQLAFPVQRHNAKETYVISLPATKEEYTASLGKSTRTGVRYQQNKVARDHPSFASRFYINDEIDEEHIRAILRLSEQRISGKAFKFSHDAHRIIRLARRCGFVHVLSIDGQLCAGSINYRIGASVFGEAIAQDPAFEHYGLGKLTVYLTICESIAKGCTKFYLGGGRFDFKSRMLGEQLEMDRLNIYRSYGSYLYHIDRVAMTAFDGYIRQMKLWLRKHEDRAAAQRVIRFFYGWKSLMQKS